MANILFPVVGVWRTQEDARAGLGGEAHRAAMRAAIGLYEEWVVERLKLVIEGDEDGGVGKWRIGQWDEVNA